MGTPPVSLLVSTVPDDRYSLVDLVDRDWTAGEVLPDAAHTANDNSDLIVSLRSQAEMERTNAKHEGLVARVARRARDNGFRCLRNTFVDLYVSKAKDAALFEMKTNSPDNTISQVRKGVAQLYEYEYQQRISDTPLVLVLEQEPLGPAAWVVEYLAESRLILPVWSAGSRFLGHPTSRDALPWLVDS